MAQSGQLTPFDHEGLWNKAQLFINRMAEPSGSRTEEERMLWASLALELLAKAALSKLNPVLIADPMDDGKSVLLAAGIGADLSNFKTIPAKAAFSRCGRAFPPFSATEATLLAATRNEDLHSANVPFGQVHASSWWERFWAQAIILITAQDRELTDLLSPEDASVVEGHLARNRDNMDRRAQALIERARQRSHLVEQGRLSERVAARMRGHVSFMHDYSALETCPACEARGWIGGDAVLETELLSDPESGLGPEILTVGADTFTCDACGLVLENQDLVLAAGLPESFDVEQDYKPEKEYMNE